MPEVESPIEEIFAHNADKYFREDLILEPQVWVTTLGGDFRVDFMVKTSHRIAFECDGAEFHDRFRDEFRDALILGDDQADVVFHIPGSLLYSRPEDVFFVLGQWEPDVVSERGMTNLAHLASERAHESNPEPGVESVLLWSDLLIRRSQQAVPGFRQHWPYLYDWSRKRGIRDLDELVKRRMEENMASIRRVG